MSEHILVRRLSCSVLLLYFLDEVCKFYAKIIHFRINLNWAGIIFSILIYFLSACETIAVPAHFDP